MNFEQFWKKNKDVLEEEGVSKLSAKFIWTEAINRVTQFIIKEKLKTGR